MTKPDTNTLIDKLEELNDVIKQKKREAKKQIEDLQQRHKQAREYVIQHLIQNKIKTGQTTHNSFNLEMKIRKQPINDEILETILLTELVKSESEKPKNISDNILKLINKDRKETKSVHLTIKKLKKINK